MSKAIWIVVDDIPHRGHGEGCEDFPDIEDVKSKIRTALYEITREPLVQGSTRFSGPNPKVELGVADSRKVRVFEQKLP